LLRGSQEASSAIARAQYRAMGVGTAEEKTAKNTAMLVIDLRKLVANTNFLQTATPETVDILY